MTTIDRDELRELAKEAHFWGGVEQELGDGVIALLDALDRAEARLQAQRAAHADQIAYWQGEARIAQDRATRAEARIQAVRDVIDRKDADLDAMSNPPRAHRGVLINDIRRALDGDA